MSLSNHPQFRKYGPFAVASIISIGALIYFIISGQGSANVNTRTLQKSDPKVESVQIQDQTAGQKNASIKCKDGSTYEIYFPAGTTDFSSVASSKCPQD